MSHIDNLPPLPGGTRGTLVGDWTTVYTADQMREYAREAIAESEAESLPAAWNAGRNHGQGDTTMQSSAWLPMDSAPKDGTEIIGRWQFGGGSGQAPLTVRCDVMHWIGWRECWSIGPGDDCRVGDDGLTGWMPLPEVKP